MTFLRMGAFAAKGAHGTTETGKFERFIDLQIQGIGKVEADSISIRRSFDFAWPVLKKRFGLFATVLLVMFGAWVVLEVTVITGQRFGVLLWVLAHLAFLVFFAGLQAGLLQICFALYEGRKPVFTDVFAHLALGPKFLLGQVLYLLIVVGGLAFLVVPGIYFAVRYALFGFCMVEGETDLIRSFQRSGFLSTGAKMYLLRMLTTLFVLNVIGACLFGLGLFITVPLSVLMMTAAFRRLSSLRLAAEQFVSEIRSVV